MNIFVFAYDRFNTMTTSLWLGQTPHYVLCHTPEQYEKFLAGGRLGAGAKLICTNQPKGLPYNRNWALDNIMLNGDWALFLVDDFKKCTYLSTILDISEPTIEVNGQNQAEWRKAFSGVLTAPEFISLSKNDIDKAEQDNHNLIGYSLTENVLYRTRKYSTGGLADGRAWWVRKTNLRFDTRAVLMDDYAWCALNKKTYGGYLINNWIYFEMERYTSGGCGTKEERMGAKIEECKYLTDTYSEFIAYADKVGWPAGSHIRLRAGKVDPNQTTLF